MLEKTAKNEQISFEQKEYFISRELSWLSFNHRVLMEADNVQNPPLERMKFLSIVSSNLDEFFMIRVASLRDQVQAGYKRPDAAGLTPRQQLFHIAKRAHDMVARQGEIYASLFEEMRVYGLRLLCTSDLDEGMRAYLEDYFNQEIYPVLTPMAVDLSRPFPLLSNKSLNLAVLLRKEPKEEEIAWDPDGKTDKEIKKEKKRKDDMEFATVQVPGGLPRLISLPGGAFVLLEDVIRLSIHRLFLGRQVLHTSLYRITRNADLSIEEEEAQDLLTEIEKSLKQRKWGAVIRLEVQKDIPAFALSFLQSALEVLDEEVYTIQGPLQLDFLMKEIYPLLNYDHFKYPSFSPSLPYFVKGELFTTLQKRDVLLHHPFDSFDPVVWFIQEAADDENVLAIKQTLYRVSGDSPIVHALENAAEKGKQVTVLLEVKARFDEENNIQWGRRLEKAGCHVIYGLIGLKTHSKITLIVRREEDGIARYVHLGTGNYNDITAQFYTDFSLLTTSDYFGADASAFFNRISGYSEPPHLHRLVAAPNQLRERFLELITAETAAARRGEKAEIYAKMNALVDSEIIRSLYAASHAGVQVHLLVRGICCLRPGIAGVSENIRVRSVVGRFLEHSRIYLFHSGGRPEVYLSSADLMPRNLDRRVELLFPVEDPALSSQIAAILFAYFDDNQKAWEMQSDGSYVRATGEEPFSIQDALLPAKKETIWDESEAYG